MRKKPSGYAVIQRRLGKRPTKWLVTGAAGFIGSHLVEKLLKLNQKVVGLDNLQTGNMENLEDVRRSVTSTQWRKFRFIEGDILDATVCRRACRGVGKILHQAALGSVPRSLENPMATHNANVTGFLNVMLAARMVGISRVVYASSSSVYGDQKTLSKSEPFIGNALSPYAVSKRCDELYAEIFSRCYGLEMVGLRYFNVFGPRQNPEGPYAAVIPCWIQGMLRGQPTVIHGDGRTCRDFCFVANVVQANLMAATTNDRLALGRVYNVGLNGRTSLKRLHGLIRRRLTPHLPSSPKPAQHGPERPGDVRHSRADITSARRWINYCPAYSIEQGIDLTVSWFLENQ